MPVRGFVVGLLIGLAVEPLFAQQGSWRGIKRNDLGQEESVEWSSIENGEGGGEGVPVGAIVLIISGACPAGFEEESSLAGKFLVGTTDAAGDVGTGGGADTVTAVINHTHGVTDPGHNHTQNSHNHTQDAHTHTQNAHNHAVTDPGHQHGLDEGATDGNGTFMDRSNAASATTAVTNSATTGLTVNNATATNQNATATNQAATATNQSATTGVTTQNPAGGVASIDNRPAFVRVIFCRST